jgi:hypothetical protein
MPTTPSGILSLPLSYLRLTLADVTAFRTWAGASDQAAALALIYVEATTSFATKAALVTWGNGFRRSKNAGGSRAFFQQSGDLQLIFRESISLSSVPTIQDAAYTVLNNLGGIITGMEALAGTAGYLDIREIALANGPYRLQDSEKAAKQVDFWETVFRVEYEGFV